MSPAPLDRDVITSTHDQARAAGARPPVSVRPGRRTRTDLPRRTAGMLRLPDSAGSYRDPLFERPDRIEDDYYRFRNRRRGLR
jgi:hypothetical protein